MQLLKEKMAFKRIREQSNVEAFQLFADKLARTAQNMQRLHIQEVPLPNLIFAAAPGSGVTMHIRLLSDLIRQLRLMPFAGEEECFEWAIRNDDKDVDTFFRRINRAAGFYGQFRGIIGLDISGLIKDKDKIPPMNRLMEYVDARQGKILFVFIIPIDTPQAVQEQLLGQFASRTPAEIIELPFPRREAIHFLETQLEAQHFSIKSDARAKLEEALDALADSKDFEGFQTLQNLADEILWRKISGNSVANTQIQAKDVAFILEEDGYLARLLLSSELKNKRRIGFGAERRNL